MKAAFVFSSVVAMAGATNIYTDWVDLSVFEHSNAEDPADFTYEAVWAEDSHQGSIDLCERIWYDSTDGERSLCCTPSDRLSEIDGCANVFTAYGYAGESVDWDYLPVAEETDADCSCSGIDLTFVSAWLIGYDAADDAYNLATPVFVEVEVDDYTPPEIAVPSDAGTSMDYIYEVEKCTYYEVLALEAFDETDLEIGDAGYTVMYGATVSSDDSQTGHGWAGGVMTDDNDVDVDTPGTYVIVYEAYDLGGYDYQYTGEGCPNAANEVVLVVVVEDTSYPDMSFGNEVSTIECGEETDIPDGLASCTNLPCSDEPEVTSYYSLDADFSTCVDSDTWNIGYGGCEAYAYGSELNAYCATDGADLEGACPSACGTCTEEFECADDEDWSSDYGDCASYSESYASSYGTVGYNHAFCEEDMGDDGLTTAAIGCPVSCDTCDTDYAEVRVAELDEISTFVGLSAVGTYVVPHTCDDGYQTTTGYQTVIVEDTTPPSITCPDDVELWFDLTFYEDYTHESESDDCGDDAVVTDDAEEAVDQGTIGTYYVTFTATDDVGLTATCEQQVILIDVTEPECNFAEDCSVGEFVDIEACTGTYTEYSVECEDDYDADIQSKITSSGDVDIDVWSVGTFFIYYDACDQSDNCAPTVTRTIVVADNTDPMLTVVGDETYIIEASADADSIMGAGAKCTDTCTALTARGSKGWAHGPRNADMKQFVTVEIEALTYNTFLDSCNPDVEFADDQQYYCGEDHDAMAARAIEVQSDISSDGAMRSEVEMALAGLQETCGVYQITYSCTDWVGNTDSSLQWVAVIDTTDPDIYGETATSSYSQQSYWLFASTGTAGVVAGSAAVFVGAVGLVAVATVMAAQRSRRNGYQAVPPV